MRKTTIFKKLFFNKTLISATVLLIVLWRSAVMGPAIAGGAYSISGTGAVTAFTANISGTASAVPYVGQCNQQHVAVDWGLNGDSVPNNWDYGAIVFNPACTDDKHISAVLFCYCQ